MSRVLVAMSGGVDSSVAAALLVEQGHEVAGVTLRLWGGESDSGCCSVADVDDARRVAQQLAIRHHVFNFSDGFDTHVVGPYVDAHSRGVTPNPCIECNRHLKFDRLMRRADQLGYSFVATGHHVRRVADDDGGGGFGLARAVDLAKDQSYVVHMLGQRELARCLFPIGEMTKTDVRDRATALGLRTADKPDSQDVCFIAKTGGGRRGFLSARIPLRSATVVGMAGEPLGTVEGVELITVGQRKGVGVAAGAPRYVVEVDPAAGRVVMGTAADLLVPSIRIERVSYVREPTAGEVLVQCSAHGTPVRAEFRPAEGADRGADAGEVVFAEPTRRVARGQSVVLYRADRVLGGGTAA